MRGKADTRAHVLASSIGRIMPFLVWLLLPERAEREQASFMVRESPFLPGSSGCLTERFSPRPTSSIAKD